MADVGRPTLMTDETVKQLEAAYANDATDEQACFIANISKQTLYNYQDKHPEFVDRKNALKDMIKYQAKIKVREAIMLESAEKPETAKWYLERKAKDEFSSRQEVSGADGKDLIPSPIMRLDDIINNENESSNTSV